MRRHSRGAWPYSFPPNCAFSLNRDSPQAEALRLWLPTLGSRGANVWRDYSGYGLDGAFKGPGEPAWVTDGEFGAALKFDGNDDYVNVNSVVNALSTTTVGTWAAWVRPTDATPTIASMVIHFGDTNASERLQIDIKPTGQLRGLSEDVGVMQWILEADNAIFSDNIWTHVALVQNGIEPILYADGVAVAQTFAIFVDKASWFFELTGLDNGRIGDRNYKSRGEENYFDGLIANVRISNCALPPSVIYQMAHDAKWDLYRPSRQPAAASVGFRRHMGMTGVGVEVG